uniref:Putative secreted protein n=1 Tax=Ixodes ricinus TaxID=34613 RepID=A0A6B0U905_IXORI
MISRFTFSSRVLLSLWMVRCPSDTAATSSSSRKITLLVCSMMALASEAKKYSISLSSPGGPNSVVDAVR